VPVVLVPLWIVSYRVCCHHQPISPDQLDRLTQGWPVHDHCGLVLCRAGAARRFRTDQGGGGMNLLTATARRMDPAGFPKVSAHGMEERRCGWRVRVMLDIGTPARARRALGKGHRVVAYIKVEQIGGCHPGAAPWAEAFYRPLCQSRGFLLPEYQLSACGNNDVIQSDAKSSQNN
jgi:hypothetical protein